MKILSLILFAAMVTPAYPQDNAAISKQIYKETADLESKVCSDSVYKPKCDSIYGMVKALQGPISDQQRVANKAKIDADTKTLIAQITADKKYSAAVAHIKQLKSQIK